MEAARKFTVSTEPRTERRFPGRRSDPFSRSGEARETDLQSPELATALKLVDRAASAMKDLEVRSSEVETTARAIAERTRAEIAKTKDHVDAIERKLEATEFRLREVEDQRNQAEHRVEQAEDRAHAAEARLAALQRAIEQAFGTMLEATRNVAA